jgi:hypothetical protein
MHEGDSLAFDVKKFPELSGQVVAPVKLDDTLKS